MWGCEKDNILEENNIDLFSFKHNVVFFVDGEEVSSILKQNYEDLLIVERQEIDYENKIITTERLGFTSEEGYINFGIANGYPLKEEREFVRKMREYIEINNIEEYYEVNGKLPETYLEFEKNLYTSLFPENKNVPSLLIGLVLSKEPYGMGPNWIAFIKTWPVMLPGWNNAVSSYQPIGLAGIVSFYSRTLYRDHLFTRVQWAMTWYNMGWADNSVSSWFRN